MERLAMYSRLVMLVALAVQNPQVVAQSTTAQDLPDIQVSSLGYEDLQGELTVSPYSTYCNWKPVMGPVCIYNKTNQVVVVPPGLRLTLGQLELEIHQAKTVHVYPTCVSWIQIFSAGLVSTLPAKVEQDCRTWLRVYDSKIDTVAYGVKDLTIVNAQVNTINLSDQRDFMALNSTINSIEALDWKGYRGTILNTSILRVNHIVARDNWHIVDSHFGFVMTEGMMFNSHDMSLVNSTISHIASQGLMVMSGTVSFANVTIDFLETNAIVVSSPEGFLSLTNITIVSAMAPCIVVPDSGRILLVNVTMMDTPLNLTSPFLKFQDEEIISESNTTIQMESERKGCSTNITTITCDFNNVDERIVVKGGGLQGYSLVALHNARALQVVSTGCQQELQLHAVNGTLPHILPVTSNASSDDPCNMTLKAWESHLLVISGEHINSMSISHSWVKRLHGGQLEHFSLLNSTVTEMDGVEVVGGGALWKDVKIGTLVNLTLSGPLTSQHLHIQQKVEEGSVIIDHPNATTSIEKLRLSMMGRGSMVVRQGSRLVLNDVLAISVAREAIMVEEGASVQATSLRSVMPSYDVFSVASLDQVELSKAGHATDLLVHVRRPPPSVDDLSNLTISTIHTSPYCRTIPFVLQVCDFSNAPEGEVSVDLMRGQQSRRAIVRSAASVTIYPSCIEKLILTEVINATTVENGRDCVTWLEATGVHFSNITCGVHDVTLTSCTVELLAPDHSLRDLDLESSTVTRIIGIHWSGYTGVFNHSHLGRVEGMVADSRMIMSNSSINSLMKDGLVIMAEASISNTTINEVQEGGITIKGKLHMQGVTIGTLAKGAIVVSDGLLQLSNVKIVLANEASIVAGQKGGVSFQNVTVAGKIVHWRGYLADSSTALNQSLIFLNKAFIDDNKRVPTLSLATDESTTTSTPSKLSPKASSVFQTQTTASGDDTLSAVSQDLLVASTNTSWKWAGAGIGFFVGLLVGCCLFVAIKVIRPNKGMLSMPTVFWRVKDDQQELLQEDHTTLEVPNNCKEQGYHTVPGSEVY
ncbi:uncharacterized protein [Panulirus ornatus]|uniref:uncharacterized protein n=1 Tax=Panulirus ornatus TaxID=150431 RepID=UPI003A89D27D